MNAIETTTRRGKIARLPKAVRDELNHRLEAGTPGAQLVDWLNGLPEVQAVLAAEFAGQPVNEQNLSAWRQGGWQQWVRYREALAWTRQMVEGAQELTAEGGDTPLAEHLSAPAAVVLGQLLQEAADSDEAPAERRRAVLAVARELGELRRHNHEAQRLRLAQQRWAAEVADAAANEAAAAEYWPWTQALLYLQFADILERKAKEWGSGFGGAEVSDPGGCAGPVARRDRAEALAERPGIKPNQS